MECLACAYNASRSSFGSCRSPSVCFLSIGSRPGKIARAQARHFKLCIAHEQFPNRLLRLACVSLVNRHIEITLRALPPPVQHRLDANIQNLILVPSFSLPKTLLRLPRRMARQLSDVSCVRD